MFDDGSNLPLAAFMTISMFYCFISDAFIMICFNLMFLLSRRKCGLVRTLKFFVPSRSNSTLTGNNLDGFQPRNDLSQRKKKFFCPGHKNETQLSVILFFAKHSLTCSSFLARGRKETNQQRPQVSAFKLKDFFVFESQSSF